MFIILSLWWVVQEESKRKNWGGGGGGGRKRKKRSSKLALHNARVTHGASLGLSKGGTGPGLMAKTGCPSPSYEYGGTVISIVIGRLLHTQGMRVGLGLSGGGAGPGLEVKTGCSRPYL